jgi:hypothetical protein
MSAFLDIDHKYSCSDLIQIGMCSILIYLYLFVYISLRATIYIEHEYTNFYFLSSISVISVVLCVIIIIKK